MFLLQLFIIFSFAHLKRKQWKEQLCHLICPFLSLRKVSFHCEKFPFKILVCVFLLWTCSVHKACLFHFLGVCFRGARDFLLLLICCFFLCSDNNLLSVQFFVCLHSLGWFSFLFVSSYLSSSLFVFCFVSLWFSSSSWYVFLLCSVLSSALFFAACFLLLSCGFFMGAFFGVVCAWARMGSTCFCFFCHNRVFGLKHMRPCRESFVCVCPLQMVHVGRENNHNFLEVCLPKTLQK